MNTLTKKDFFLVFLVNNEKYACQLDSVSGILQYYKVDKLKNVSEHFIGATEIEKQYIPVVDMGMKLERKKSNNGSGICVVLFIQGIDEVLKVGVKVDKLDEILEVLPEEIHNYSFSSGNVNDCMLGNFENKENKINIINTEALFSLREIYDIKNIYYKSILNN